jgi:hypothetical protein
MKKLLFFFAFLPSFVLADRLGGLNPNSNVLLSTQIGGGSASSLQVSLGGVQISSPTSTVNFSSNVFTASESPTGQSNIGINFSSVASVSSIPSPGGSNTNVQFNNSGSFGGDSGFQYDSSVSSVTLGGKLGITDNSNSIGIGDGGSDPLITLDDNNGSPGGGLSFLSFGTEQSSWRNGTTSFDLNITTNSTPLSRISFPKNNQKSIFKDTSGIGRVQFDMIGNSSFTIPVYLSSITITNQLTDSAGSNGSLTQVLTKTASGPAWQNATGGSGSSIVSAFGTIYTSSSNVTQTGISTTPVKLACFLNSSDSNNVTLSTTNSQITVTTTTSCNLFFNVLSTGVGNFNQYFEIRVNGSTTGFTCQDTPSARCVINGQKNLTVNDVVTVYTNVNLVGNSTITVTDAQLSVSAVGGTGGSGGSSSGVSVYPATSTIIVPGINFTGNPYPLGLQEISASAGLCQYNNGCIPANQYETTTSSFDYVATVFQAGTTQYWQTNFILPGNYVSGSTFTAKIDFTSTMTITTSWKIDMSCVQNGGSSDTAWGTAVSVSSGSASGTFNLSQESSAVTPSGTCAPGGQLQVRLYRNGDIVGDAYFRRLLIYYEKNKYSSQ